MAKEDTKDFLEIVERGKALLEDQENLELYDKSSLYEYEDDKRKLLSELQKTNCQRRELSIGVIGEVKAGKSSFLNALLFDGQEFLPKSITPSTAVLTVISYSETPKAIVHFYDREDWAQIEEKADRYQNGLKEAYEHYIKGFEEREKQRKKKRDREEIQVAETKLSLEEYEKKIHKASCKDEQGIAANELAHLVSNEGILEKLGTQEEITERVMDQLKDYIDANGEYSPIVKYVELLTDNEGVKGIKIVDTPGLCDPVVSRGDRTKEYLRECDVALLLSRCSQFMSASTIQLMASSLPNEGIQEILVIGSRYDEGIMNDKGGDFRMKAKKSKQTYDRQFCDHMAALKRSGVNSPAIVNIEKSPRLYVSSMCYAIDKKKKAGRPLNKEEDNVYRQLKGSYVGFEDGFLEKVSGMAEVKKALNEVIKRKEEIMREKDGQLISRYAYKFVQLLYDVRTTVETNNVTLKNTKKEELEERSRQIQEALVLSRKQMKALFEINGLQCEKKVISIQSLITQEMTNYTAFEVKKEFSEEVDTYRTGWFGMKRETVKTTVTTNKASTDHTIINLQGYGARCKQIINDEFTYLFDRVKFEQELKQIIQKAYEAGEDDYGKDDVVLPLKRLMTKLEIPEVGVDVNASIDMVRTRFAQGFAVNDAIHELSALQAELLSKIDKDYETQVEQNGKKISSIMQKEATGFADELEEKFVGKREQLLNQMEEQEKYLKLNASFAQKIKELEKEFKNYTE